MHGTYENVSGPEGYHSLKGASVMPHLLHAPKPSLTGRVTVNLYSGNSIGEYLFTIIILLHMRLNSLT